MLKHPIAAGITLAALVALVATLPALAAGAHVVQSGETLYSIALRYHLSVEGLARANGLSNPHHIRVGQVLRIPEADSQVPSPRKLEAQASGQRAEQVPVTYTVRPGDTLFGIAHRYGIIVQALTELNRLTSDTLRIGQRLRIPAAGPTRSAARSPRHRLEVGRVRLRPDVPPAAESPQLAVGTEVKAPRPMRVRSGPKTYYTMVALLSTDTPLRIVGVTSGWYQVQLPNEELGWVAKEDFRPAEQDSSLRLRPGQVRGGAIIQEAMGYLGIPYVWGGHSSSGVDCSGFVYVVFAPHVPSLARMSSFDYFQTGAPVDRANLQPGDLVFFTTYAPGPSHVGIYIGEGKFIHASSASHRVNVTSLEEPYYAGHYIGARRLLRP